MPKSYGNRGYGANRKSGATKDLKRKKLFMWVGIGAAVVAVAVLLILIFSGTFLSDEERRQKILETGTFYEGVSIEGVDVSGMKYAEAEPLVKEKATALMEGLQLTYQVGENTYALSAGQMGAEADIAATLEEAMFYGREGSGEEQREEIDKAKNEGVDILIKIGVNDEFIKNTLDLQGQEYNTQPADAAIAVEKSEDKENLQIRGSLVITPEAVGEVVNQDELIGEIKAALAGRDWQTPLPTTIIETQPTVTEEQLRENCELMGSYRTTFKDSAYGRRFNIWKMGTVVNGVVLQPGESWSINDAAGPRTKENGWEDAAGIKSGAYVDEPGGGICQVSSTLYIALLKSEVEIVDRSHHSWPLKYVPTGMDATISTGAPDFVFKNNYDFPITVIVNCDGKDERYIKVEVYGPSMDYTVDLENEIVSEEEPKDTPEVVTDPSMKPGTSAWTKPRHERIEVKVYKVKKDKETGKQIGEKELLYTDVYRAFKGQLTVGPSATPTPTPSPSETAPSPAPTGSGGADPAPTESGEGAQE